MSNAPRFVDGVRVKEPAYHAPRTAIVNLSINKAELIAALQKEEGEWVYINILRGKQSGALYAAYSDWRPDPSRGERNSRKAAASKTPPPSQYNGAHHDGPNYEDDDIPF